MVHYRLARITAALTLALGVVGVTFMASPSAQATQPRAPAYYQEIHFINFDPSVTPQQIAAEHFLTCPPPIFRCGLATTIYRLENGSWVKVATGESVAVVNCSGPFTTTYKDQSGDELTAPCS